MERISYKTHPALQFFQRHTHVAVRINEEDDKTFRLIEEAIFPKMVPFIQGIDRNNIIKPSTGFVEAAMRSSINMLAENEKDFAEELNGVSGCVLLHQLTLFYYVRTTVNKEIFVEFVAFHNDDNYLVALGMFTSDNDDRKKEGKDYVLWFSKMFQLVAETHGLQKGDDDAARRIQYETFKMIICCLLLFKRFAKVETKEYLAGQLSRITRKPVNGTKVNVTYLDSKWFTNIVRSEGFDVRGHFRLQPYGIGRKERRLIYINPFHKEGYTAPARKLKEKN